MPRGVTWIFFLTSRELHNSSMMPPGRGRLAGLKGDFTSLSGEAKSISSRRSGDSIRLSPTMGCWEWREYQYDKFLNKKSIRTKPGPDKGMSTLLGGLSASLTRPSKGKTSLSTSVVGACREIGLFVLSLCFFKALGYWWDRVQHKMALTAFRASSSLNPRPQSSHFGWADDIVKWAWTASAVSNWRRQARHCNSGCSADRCWGKKE